MSDLLGAQEAAELLGLTRQALHSRRQAADFPAPVAQLAAGPVWERAQLVEYAAGRTRRFHERPSIEQLARDELTVEEAAGLLGVDVGRLRVLAEALGLPGSFSLAGRLQAVPRGSLGLYGRALAEPVERAVVA